MFTQDDIDALSDNRKATYWAVGLSVSVCSILSLGAVYYWLSADVVSELRLSLPGEDGRPENAGVAEQAADLTGFFEQFEGLPSTLPGTWPSFRGPNFDNVVSESPPLASSWPAEGPEVLWSVDIGEGYAAPAVLDGTVYLMDYDDENKADALRAFSLEDGAEIWRRSYNIKVKRFHGMSRTVPAVTEKYIVTMGPRCHVVCLERETGKFLWGLDFMRDYGTMLPEWYTAQCPIIDDGKAILAPCGTEVLMMAVDCATGEILWETPNTRGIDMSHSSIIPMTLAGKKMYVYGAAGGLLGVSAEGDDEGELLWERPWPASVVAPSPVQVADDKVFMTRGYGYGNMLLQISQTDGQFSVTQLYEKLPAEGLACEQHTPIFADGALYSVMPKHKGSLDRQFVSFDLDGNLLWSSGKEKQFGLGPFLMADGKIFVLDDDGTLTLVDATASSYVQLAEAKIEPLDGHDAWGPIALVGDRMLLRNSHRMICVDVGVS